MHKYVVQSFSMPGAQKGAHAHAVSTLCVCLSKCLLRSRHTIQNGGCVAVSVISLARTCGACRPHDRGGLALTSGRAHVGPDERGRLVSLWLYANIPLSRALSTPACPELRLTRQSRRRGPNQNCCATALILWPRVRDTSAWPWSATLRSLAAAPAVIGSRPCFKLATVVQDDVID